MRFQGGPGNEYGVYKTGAMFIKLDRIAYQRIGLNIENTIIIFFKVDIFILLKLKFMKYETKTLSTYNNIINIIFH